MKIYEIIEKLNGISFDTTDTETLKRLFPNVSILDCSMYWDNNAKDLSIDNFRLIIYNRHPEVYENPEWVILSDTVALDNRCKVFLPYGEEDSDEEIECDGTIMNVNNNYFMKYTYTAQ